MLPLRLKSLDISRNANIHVIAIVADITKGDSRPAPIPGEIVHSTPQGWLELASGYLEYQDGEFSIEDDHPWKLE